MSRSRFWRFKHPRTIAFALSIMLAAGCATRQQRAGDQARYSGPTLDLPELIARINANNQRIPTLVVSDIDYHAVIHDPESGKTTTIFESGQGALQYRAPAEFRMRLNKALAGNVLDMGMNRQRYWLLAPEGPDTLWWGYVDRRPAEASRIPIRPQDLLEVLSVSTLNSDLLALPAPLLRYNNDRDTYMLVWFERTDDRYVASREVWYDRQTLRPILVLLFDESGQIVLRAYLSHHRPVGDGAEAPVIAGRYDILFPLTQSRLELEFGKIELTRKNTPNDASFRFPPPNVASTEKQLDAERSK